MERFAVGNVFPARIRRRERDAGRESIIEWIRRIGFWRLCRGMFLIFIADHMIDTYAMLDKVLEWLGSPNDDPANDAS
jgi:hypothetical protein